MNSASGCTLASRLRVEGDEPVETVEEIRHVHRGPPKQPQFLCVSLIDVTAKPLREEDRRLSAARRRRGVELFREQNVLEYDGLIKIALADAEASAGDVERALAIIEEALATSGRTGHRASDAELHRVRGDMLLKSDRANTPPAEEAFHSAIAVAHQQGTRGFELRASLSLAKLYQSTGRPVDAHAVLAPALEGFSPTPEMPEIAEAQALIERLA